MLYQPASLSYDEARLSRVEKELEKVKLEIAEVCKQLNPAPKEPQMEYLDIGQALDWLRKGHKITRATWNNDCVYVYLFDGTAKENHSGLLGNPDGWLPELRVQTISGKHACWMPNHAELLAIDWRAIP